MHYSCIICIVVSALHRRDFNIEQQSPLQEIQYWLILRTPIMIGLDNLIIRRYICVVTKGKDVRKHL